MNIAQKVFHALFSPPRSIPKSDNEDHNRSSANPRSARTSPRCQFTFSDGRQCRSQRASFCVHHASKQERGPGAEGAPDAALVAPEVVALCSDLTTATNINRAVAQVFLLMAQGRIPQKQAVAFGYLAQLLLQTVPGIRSEFVSAFGYHPWEEKIKASLTPTTQQPPPTSESPADEPDGVILSESASGGERRISPETSQSVPQQEIPPTPVNKARLSARSLREGLTPADYESVFHRSCDLFARKYDTTPEGRREANALALDLELMKPPDSKPPKGYFGEVVALVRRLRAHQQQKSAAAVNASRPSPGPTAASAAPVNLPPPPPVARSKPSPARTINKPEPRTVPLTPDYALPALAAKPAPPPPVRRVPPTRPAPAAPRPEADPEFPETKASLWDGRWRPPMPLDPFAPRSTAFERKLRGMSNAGWRRWQHQNSRCF
jgi:hypothetical protein